MKLKICCDRLREEIIHETAYIETDQGALTINVEIQSRDTNNRLTWATITKCPYCDGTKMIEVEAV